MTREPAASLTTQTTLLGRLADGSDQEAWHAFRDRYAALILGYARRHGLQTADCDDVLQEVCADLLKAMPHFVYDPTRGRFRDYLYKMTRAALCRVARARRRDLPAMRDLLAAQAEPADDRRDDLWEDEWRDYHVRRALESIRPCFGAAIWTAFQRYALQAEPADLVATDLNLSVSQVYKAKSDIKTALATQIANQVEEEG